MQTEFRINFLQRVSNLIARCDALAKLKNVQVPWDVYDPEPVRYALAERLSAGLLDEAEDLFAEYAIRVKEIVEGRQPAEVTFKGTINQADALFVKYMRDKVRAIQSETPPVRNRVYAWDWAIRLSKEMQRMHEEFEAMKQLAEG